MAIRHVRLTVGLFFLVMGIVLLTVRFAMPEVAPKLDPTRLFLGGVMAIVLSAWNVAKWYLGWQWFQQQATPVRQPLQPDPAGRKDEAPNPDFDFSKKDEPQDKPAQ